MKNLIRLCAALCVAAAVSVPSAAAALAVGDVVTKDALVRTVRAGSGRNKPIELVRASTGRLSAMRTRLVEGTRASGIMEHHEVFLALYGDPRFAFGDGMFDRAVVARRTDTGYRVLFVAERDVEFIQRLTTLRPPGIRSAPELLHVRYAQTGSGGVTRDVLFALAEGNTLVEVPIEQADLSTLLDEGEYLCCGSFTSFDEEEIEQTVFVTRSGRGGITHRVRVSYELEGRFRHDTEAGRYVPDFRLVLREKGEREGVDR